MCEMPRMMRPSFTVLALAALLAGLAHAPAEAGPRHCPPGLAKKNPPCIPPGQVGRRGGHWDDDDWDDDRHHWRGDDHDEAYREGYRDGYRIAVGDLLGRGDYELIRDPGLYGLRPYGRDTWRYYLVRDMIVRADPETRRVLAIIGLVDALLN